MNNTTKLRQYFIYKMNEIDKKLQKAEEAESKGNFREAIIAVNSLRNEDLSRKDLEEVTDTEILLANKQNPITHYYD